MAPYEQSIVEILKTRWVPKEELMVLLGTNSERAARSFIHDLAEKEHLPVMATCTKKGYKIYDPTSEDDNITARAILREEQNKALSLFKRRAALKNAYVDFNQPKDPDLALIF